MNRKNGYEAKNVVAKILKKYPFIRPVLILVKYIIRQRGLNETFTGGMGSYLLFSIIFAYVQYMTRNGEVYNDEFNLGTFLLGFLKFICHDFNYRKLGISLRNGGEFFHKSDNQYLSYNDHLCVENFQDVYHDVGRPTHQFPTIMNVFNDVLNKLHKLKRENQNPSFPCDYSYLSAILL